MPTPSTTDRILAAAGISTTTRLTPAGGEIHISGDVAHLDGGLSPDSLAMGASRRVVVGPVRPLTGAPTTYSLPVCDESGVDISTGDMTDNPDDRHDVEHCSPSCNLSARITLTEAHAVLRAGVAKALQYTGDATGMTA